jgi:FAD dependent oxidoreductase TIGR03364
MDRQRVVIVGGGVVGTMHAVEAIRRHWEVVHLEADAAPRRASVRNFGLIWLSGRATGEELDLAVRARELWESTAATVRGIGFRASGSLTIATHRAELTLMQDLAARPEAPLRQLAVLDPAELRQVNPAVRGEVLGGLWCQRDAVVEPEAVLGALRAHLAGHDGYRWMAGRRAVEVGTGAVVDHLGVRHAGSMVIVCPGDGLTGLGGAVGAALARAPLRRCRLQMMQTAPSPDVLTTAIADGDSMRYYPAFDLPGRSQLPPAAPDTVSSGMQLLMVQRAAGGLTIGDTHVYDEPFDFAVEESLYAQLRDRAALILGWSPPPVVRRWAGVYSTTTDARVCIRDEAEPGVLVVTGLAGRGMTLSPAVAEQTFRVLER